MASRPRMFERGGRRTRPQKVSGSLTADHVRQVLLACERASSYNLAFNRFITIHWERAGIAPGPTCAKASAAFLKCAADLVRRRGGHIAYIWIRENDYGDGSKGDHVHILLHLPAGISIGRVQRGWIRRITGKPYQVRSIATGRIGGTAAAWERSSEHYAVNLASVVEYILKGVRQADARNMGLGRWGDGGTVHGKRVGISKNLVR